MLMISTKTGDKGWTGFGGKRVRKDSPIIEALGALDEAQAVLGGLGLEEIQGDLYQIMALKFNKKRILDLESKIKILEGELEPVDKFIIFQKTEAVYLNWVRTIIRRAERKVMVWKNNKDILVYLNRLSDFIYLKARKAEEK